MSDLLQRPPEEGVRLVALRQLESAVAARERLTEPDDQEALHDLRVALRRLRSTLSSFKPYLGGSLSKKKVRRLRDLAATTGPGRDAEVQLAWLREQVPALARTQRSGAAWLLARTARRMDEGYEAAHAALERDLPSLAEAIRHRLSVYSTEVHLEAEASRPTFAAIAAAALKLQIEALRERLGEVSGPDDQEASHEARINAKRIRYLLEPLVEERPEVGPLVKRFKGLQDLLGELHDAHVLEDSLGEALAEAGAERAKAVLAATLERVGKEDTAKGKPRPAPRLPNREPGLLALAVRNRERRDELFGDLDARHLEGRAESFLAELEALARSLGAPAAEPEPASPQ
jgi:CHAD domain-containing protein